MRRAIVLALIFSAVVMESPAARAGGKEYRAHMTGAQFVRDVLAAPDGGPASMRRERAAGYMDGVMDAAAGLCWCPAGQEVPHELNFVVAEKLARLSPNKLKGSAAALVLDALGRSYPCEAKP